MIESLNARLVIIAVVLLLAIGWTIPNFMNTDKHWWFTKDKMVLGLDIQGGSHLVLKIDADSVVKQDVTRTATSLMSEFRDEKEQKIDIKSVTVLDPLKAVIQIDAATTADRDKARAMVEKNYTSMLKYVDTQDTKVTFEYGELYLRDFRQRLLEQAISTIRNRIDEFGVAEPSITAQGTDRILVQLPGIKDATSAKELINRTARLDFMLVADDVKPDDLQKMITDVEKDQKLSFKDMKYSEYVDKLNLGLKSKIPANTVVYFEKPESAANMEAARIPMLLKTTEGVTGDRLTNAYVGLGEYNKPIVNFAFDPVGAKQFGELTTKNTGKYMAIILDKVIKSAPVIKSPITGGKGQIEMGGGRDQQKSLNDAKLIGMALRAGALPATLEQLEERTVGPSLGADAIAKGQLAALVGAGVVFLFMLFYYKSFGLIADLSLMFNILIVLAVLSSLGATLTLPGVAGMALTIGIAVDANVIIYERVKEEMNKGASLLSAIREGYNRAFSCIIDANIMSIAVCVVLMYFGTGPVRGFAVTLLCGLVIQTFTAVFFTRAILDLLVGKLKWNLSVR